MPLNYVKISDKFFIFIVQLLTSPYFVNVTAFD